MRKKKIQNIGILGFGEVGKAISKFYCRPLIKDLERDTFKNKKLLILHVCLPYNQNFEKIIKRVNRKNKPEYIIIHSTVKVGTTHKLNEQLGNVVHSPIRGVHPKLFKGIKTFKKYIGADNMSNGFEVAKLLRKAGIRRVKVVPDSQTTELGKLLSTTYYGLCISFHAYARKLCEKNDVDFEKVMTDFNKSYNKGYTELNKKNVIRPVLYPPKYQKIGGHCIMPNAEILKKQFGFDPILRSILRHK